MKILREISLADSLSVLNALLGFSAITYLLMYGLRLEPFVIFYFSVLIDGVDGFVASKTEKSPFGKELDSLADSVSFGVFPAAALVKYNPNLFPVAALLVATSILRLARFNVLQFENFLGIPTVANALMITSLIRINAEFYALVVVSLITSILMVTDFEYIRIRNRVVLGIMAVVILLATIYQKMCYVIVLLITAYILSPLFRGILWKRL